MKTLINIFSLLLIFTSSSFSQFYADSVLADDVVEFVNIANEKTVNIDIYNRSKVEFTDDELEHLRKLYYKCYSFHLVCLNEYMAEEQKKWEKAFLNVATGKMKLRPWMRVYTLRDQLIKKYGLNFISIIGTPAFLRCRYIDLIFSKYHMIETNMNLNVHNFAFFVEDVIKGNKYFKIGDTISVQMIPNDESPAPSFIQGESYLIPLTTLLGIQDDAFNTIFVFLSNKQDAWEMGKQPKTFPIENEIIKNCEYFGVKDTSWSDFKKYFKEKYLVFD